MSKTPSDGIRKFGESFPSRGNELKKGFARAFLGSVVPATPVATGKARSNYVVGIRTKNRTIREAGIDKAGRVSLNEGLRDIARAQPGETVYISNNVPYIGALNSGSSKQVPAGFIQRAFAEAKALMPRIKTLVDEAERRKNGR